MIGRSRRHPIDVVARRPPRHCAPPTQGLLSAPSAPTRRRAQPDAHHLQRGTGHCQSDRVSSGPGGHASGPPPAARSRATAPVVRRIFTGAPLMAALRMVVAHDPGRLLRHAANGFLVRRTPTAGEPFPTVPYLLAVRQGGLREDVIEMAAAERVAGWFDPPLAIFAELPAWLGLPERAILGDYERAVLLAAILREQGQNLFARLDRPADYVDAVDALFGDLIADGVPAARFHDALERRPGRDLFERGRDADLARAYGAYLDRLATLGKSDGRDPWLACARAIESGAADLATSLGGRREIRIVGLQDLRRGWGHLVRALAASPALDDVIVYGTIALPVDLPGVVVDRLDEPDTPAARLFTAAPQRTAATATLLIAPDVDRQVDEVAQRVRQEIEGGVPPHRIAVVARQARPGVDRAIASLGKSGVAATARRRTALAEIPLIRAIGTLFTAAADGWTRSGLTEIAEQPYLECGLAVDIINKIGYRHRVEGLASWRRELRALEAQSRDRARGAAASDGGRHPERSLPPPGRVAAARERFDRFAERAAELDRDRTLLGWLGWLSRFLADDPWRLMSAIFDVPDEQFEVARLDLAGWDGLRKILTEWTGAVEAFGAGGEALSVGQFAVQLRACLSGDVALWTTTHRGVQVLEALAAAYRSFDHVFLVGMEAGAFPRRMPRSPLLSDADREALADAGLPIERRELWDARERELFRVLVAGAPRLTVSYSRLDDAGREVIRSTFVEEVSDVLELQETELQPSAVVADRMPLYRTSAALAAAVHGAGIERLRLNGERSPYSGWIADADLSTWLTTEFGDERVWSPTQLEELAKCPWAYFSKRLLRIERLDDPSDDIQPMVQGGVLHTALQRFYDAARARGSGPVFLRAGDATWAEPLLDDCVDSAFDEAAARGWLGHPAFRAARRAEARRVARGFLAWEIGQHEDMFNPRKRTAFAMIRTGVDGCELAFEDMVYEGDGVRLRYRGFIDRVEVSVDERAPGRTFIAASDYKNTRYSTPGGGHKDAWADGVVLQVPLYAYALAHLRPDDRIARVDYLALKGQEAVHQL